MLLPEVRQAAFAAALIGEPGSLPDTVVGPCGGFPTKRFNVYRNNVASSLIDALASTYPAIERLVGTEYFRAFASAFIDEHPPRSPVLLEYGGDFAEFIEDFPPLADYPYLPDVARLEWAWLRSYHAADAEVLTPEQLSALPANRLSDAVFTVHPAAALIQSDYPVLSLFEINRGDRGADDILLKNGENVLITRPSYSVEMRKVADDGHTFVHMLIEGAALGDAAERCASTRSFDLAFHIQGALEAGVFRSVSLRADQY